MIKTDNLEEYQLLICLKNFCKSSDNCHGCDLTNVCKCTSISFDELEIELKKQTAEVLTYEKI